MVLYTSDIHYVFRHICLSSPNTHLGNLKLHTYFYPRFCILVFFFCAASRLSFTICYRTECFAHNDSNLRPTITQNGNVLPMCLNFLLTTNYFSGMYAYPLFALVVEPTRCTHFDNTEIYKLTISKPTWIPWFLWEWSCMCKQRIPGCFSPPTRERGYNIP